MLTGCIVAQSAAGRAVCQTGVRQYVNRTGGNGGQNVNPENLFIFTVY